MVISFRAVTTQMNWQLPSVSFSAAERDKDAA